MRLQARSDQHKPHFDQGWRRVLVRNGEMPSELGDDKPMNHADVMEETLCHCGRAHNFRTLQAVESAHGAGLSYVYFCSWDCKQTWNANSIEQPPMRVKGGSA